MIQLAQPSPVQTPKGVRPLAACCLLDGGVKDSPLAHDCGRSVLDLDVAPDRRLLDHWLDVLGALSWGSPAPSVRVLHGGRTPPPSARPSGPLDLQIRADADGYRGPAGVIRDAMLDLEPDTDILVAEAGRMVPGGLEELVAHHRRERADVTIARDPGGGPAGVLVVGHHTLDLVAPRGFVDLKEQWLRRVVSVGLRALVHDLDASSHQIRTRLDLLQVARQASENTKRPNEHPNEPESWRAGSRLRRRLSPGWSISSSARVSPSSVVARSVVMEGASIGDDAVVSSSVVLPGAVVAPGSFVVDRIVR